MICPRCHQWTHTTRCEWCDHEPTDAELAAADRDGGRHRGRRAYALLRGLVRFDLSEHLHLVAHLLRWVALGTVVGVLAGAASAGFLVSLEWATTTREAYPWLLWLLPVAGLAVGLVYHHRGGRAADGNNLIIDEIHEPRAWIPRRMAPLVYLGTVATHLFGGSAGREGTALQMSGSLTDGFSRLVHLNPADRRLLLIAALSAGFGAVFGVPIAGAVFGLEVQAVGRIRYEALVPALTASVVGDALVRGLGVHHSVMPTLPKTPLDAVLLAKVALAGLMFALAGVAFSELTHGLKRAFRITIRWAPARPFVGGVVLIALTAIVGSRDYLGLSLPLIQRSLHGGSVVGWAFAAKIVFTALTLGSGFQGGEVTPLFVIGATLGAALGRLLGVPVPFLAALGFVAVFAGAANTPLACTIMGVELFGSGALVYVAVACVVSYVFSSHRGIYASQRIDTPKGGRHVDASSSLHDVARRRRHWLPAR